MQSGRDHLVEQGRQIVPAEPQRRELCHQRRRLAAQRRILEMLDRRVTQLVGGPGMQKARLPDEARLMTSMRMLDAEAAAAGRRKSR